MTEDPGLAKSGAPPGTVRARVLVLEDEPAMQRLLRLILEDEGYSVQVTDDGRAALETIEREGCDLVIQDLRMRKMDGLTFLRVLKARHPEVLAIVVTAYGTWETAVESMRLGAYTHLAKPFDTEDFRRLVARALQRRSLVEAQRAGPAPPLVDIVGNSPAMNAIIQMTKRIAATDTTVVLSGESGTGKELIARAIHYGSLRAKGAFVAVNCGVLTESLLESELFGHVKGAFTHAIADRQGVFDAADGGTLLLDEVGEMSPLMQVKLLRVLQTQTFRPVGGTREVKVDVRLIAATNRNLAQMVADAAFREDLYHRLNVIPIMLPPLRERHEDIPLLAGHFLARYASRHNKPVTAIDEAVMRRLTAHPWPGNVRELENTIERAVALCEGSRITEADIAGLESNSTSAARAKTPPAISVRDVRGPSYVPPAPPAEGAPAPAPTAVDLPDDGMDLEQHLLDVERAYILEALERTDGNLTEAAKLLGTSFRSIRYRVSKLGIGKSSR